MKCVMNTALLCQEMCYKMCQEVCHDFDTVPKMGTSPAVGAVLGKRSEKKPHGGFSDFRLRLVKA